MQGVPSYVKIFSLGSVGTERALLGDVVVEEKVDGSNFGFGKNDDEEIVLRSHHQPVSPDNCPGMFKAAMDYVLSLDLSWVAPGTYFYCEMLSKQKHNTIFYDRTPMNHLVLFDVVTSEGWLYSRTFLSSYAKGLGIDVIPELYRGEVTVEVLRGLLATPSYLGGSTVEGVVVKNYHEMIAPGNRLQPLFVKLVNDAFKEQNATAFHAQTTRGTIESYIASFNNEARWIKAIQNLRERGLLIGAPQDIGPLIHEIERDLKDEESENIKRVMFGFVISDILRKAKNGFPEFYKAMLADSVNQ